MVHFCTTFLFSFIKITKSLPACQITLSNYLFQKLENFIQYCSFEFWWLTFWHNCNEVLQAKIRRVSGVYRKQIDRKLQNVTQRGVGQLSMTWTMDVFLEPVLLFFWIKRKYKYKTLKNFSSKNTFPQSPKITKNAVPNAMAIDLS